MLGALKVAALCALSLPCALAPLRSAALRSLSRARAPQARTPPPAPRL